MKSKVVKVQPWRTPKRELLERDVEKYCKQWARDHGWWVRKFKAPGNRSVPDDLFAKAFPRSSRKLAVEFKKPGKTSTELQLKEQKAMRDAGWEVHEIDNKEKFVALFESIESIEAEENWLS
jgi:hypothetical protein